MCRSLSVSLCLSWCPQRRNTLPDLTTACRSLICTLISSIHYHGFCQFFYPYISCCAFKIILFVHSPFIFSLLQHYITPAQALSAPKPLQTAQLFVFLRDIFEFHRDHFLPRLEQCQSVPESLGEVFTSSEERLQVYVAYCTCKAASHTLLKEQRPFFEVRVHSHTRVCFSPTILK